MSQKSAGLCTHCTRANTFPASKAPLEVGWEDFSNLAIPRTPEFGDSEKRKEIDNLLITHGFKIVILYMVNKKQPEKQIY